MNLFNIFKKVDIDIDIDIELQQPSRLSALKERLAMMVMWFKIQWYKMGKVECACASACER